MLLSAVLLVLEHPTDGRHAAVRRVTGPRTSLLRLLSRQTAQVRHGRLLQPRQPGNKCRCH